jgi:[ribosomal protein S5]-alanine N-acetyltransferase
MALASFTATFEQLPSPHPQGMTPQSAGFAVCNWRAALPVVTGPRVRLRDLRQADAATLLRLLTTEEVVRFISPPPTTVEGFERFIAWANAQRAAGQYMCFAVVPHGVETAIGIIQVRQLSQGFGTAEWGFALGQPFWGTGLFVEAAELALAFAFDSVGVHRLEARAAVANGRGNGALRKLGAYREAILRESFSRGGHRLDQALWSILDEDWRRAKVSRELKASSGALCVRLN